MNATEIWRKHPWVWIPALAFLLINVGLALTYRVLYHGQAEGLENRIASQEAATAELVETREKRERLLALAQANLENRERFYTETLSTQGRRFTRIIAEVKELARRSGLDPTSIRYPEQEYEDFGLVKRSIDFSVEGNYVALRTFIHLLELSDSFVTLDKLDLAGGGEANSDLKIRLSLSTLFVDDTVQEDVT